MLLLDDESFLETLASLGFSLDDMIGEGATAVVLAKADRALRLSMDYASHHFLVEAGTQPRLLSPQVYADHGVVGRYTGDGDDEAFYLAELECLDPLDLAPEKLSMVRNWLEHIDDRHPDGLSLYGEKQVESLRDILLTLPSELNVPPAMQNTLLYAVDRFGMFSFDLCHTNFMMRRGSGEVLLTDPVHD